MTDIPDSWAWMAPDFLLRLLPFAAASVVVELVWRPSWMGIGTGDLSAQLTFALLARMLQHDSWRDAILAGATGGGSIFVCYAATFLITDRLMK